MKRLSLLCLCALALTVVGHKGVQPHTLTYAERGSDLGIRVFQQVVSTKPLENVVLSPHGVASILGMLLPGAHGETKKQILGGLRYKKNGKDPFFVGGFSVVCTMAMMDGSILRLLQQCNLR